MSIARIKSSRTVEMEEYGKNENEKMPTYCWVDEHLGRHVIVCNKSEQMRRVHPTGYEAFLETRNAGFTITLADQISYNYY